MLLQFKNAPNGLTSYNKPITLFEVAGEDRGFYPAKAVIRKGDCRLERSSKESCRSALWI